MGNSSQLFVARKMGGIRLIYHTVRLCIDEINDSSEFWFRVKTRSGSTNFTEFFLVAQPQNVAKYSQFSNTKTSIHSFRETSTYEQCIFVTSALPFIAAFTEKISCG